jgi:hypothetical protein
MKKLLHNGEEYLAEHIVKTDTDIIGYNGNKEVWVFRGINDWSQFQLEEGQEWDIDFDTEKEQRITDIEMAIAAILGGAM